MFKAGYIGVVITQNIYILFVYILITLVSIKVLPQRILIFVLRIGSETRMCEQNVHITLHLDGTAIEWLKTEI